MVLGLLLRVHLWGESHGCCVGALVEGLPPGLKVDKGFIDRELARRRPGRRYTTPRREPDRVEILSGVYMGYTTGAPVLLMIRNRDVDSSFYEETVRWRPRPGHADFPSRLRAMGFEDYRGGGPFSGRLTAGLVAAGALAKLLLAEYGVAVFAYLRRLGRVECGVEPPGPAEAGEWLRQLVERRDASPVYCPDPGASARMEEEIRRAVAEGGSVGGQVEVLMLGVPPGLGEVLGDALDADLAKAMFSIPGARAFELGEGARLGSMTGAEAADRLVVDRETGGVYLEPGHGGGVLGGLSTGSLIRARLTLKPTSTIWVPTATVDWRGLEEAEIRGRGRHDPAIVIRAVPVAEAAAAIVLADHLLRWLPYRVGHYLRLERGLAGAPEPGEKRDGES